MGAASVSKFVTSDLAVVASVGEPPAIEKYGIFGDRTSSAPLLSSRRKNSGRSSSRAAPSPGAAAKQNENVTVTIDNCFQANFTVGLYFELSAKVDILRDDFAAGNETMTNMGFLMQRLILRKL